MPRETFDAITESQINRASIATLADRPNSVSRYGDSNLSAQELKERFDAFPHLVQKKINEIIAALASANASKYITLADHSTGKDNLYDFIALFSRDASNGKSIADFIYALYTAEKAASPASKSISEIFNDMASRIAALESAHVALQENVSNHETRISANETRISANESGIANHETRISGIEQYLGGDNFIVDDSVAYQKIVPDNACEKAKILSVAGMSHKSKNLLPNSYIDKGESSNAGVTFTPNPDGSVTLKALNGQSSEHAYFSLTRDSIFEAGKTYTISGGNIEGASVVVNYKENGKDEYFESTGTNKFTWLSTYTLENIYIFAKMGYAHNDRIYPMVNEGNNALPYEPFSKVLRDAKMLRIVSMGRNLFDPSANIAASNKDCTALINGDIFQMTPKENVLYINSIRTVKYPAGTYTLLVQPVDVSALYTAYVYPVTDTMYVPAYSWTWFTDIDRYMTFTMGTEFFLCFGPNTKYPTRKTKFRVMLIRGENKLPYSKYGNIAQISPPSEVRTRDDLGIGTENYGNILEYRQKQYTVRSKKIVLNGNESWMKTEYDGGTYFTMQTIFEPPHPTYEGVCSHCEWRDVRQNPKLTGAYVNSIGQLIIRLSTEHTSVGEFTKYLNTQYSEETPVTLVYAMATEHWETTDLSNSLQESDYIIDVESGGTITVDTDNQLPVPSSIKYLVTYTKEG